MANRFLKALGARIETVREVRGVSRSVLAQRIGRSTSQISRIEAGESDIPVSQLGRIAAALRLPLAMLLPKGVSR